MMELSKNGVNTVRMMNAYTTLVFEVCGMVVYAFLQANDESKMMRSGMPTGMMRGGMER